MNKEGYFECGCYEGFQLDHNNNCVSIPTPEPVNSCPDNCSHTCDQGQCTCPDDMVLAEDGFSCQRRHHKKSKANVVCDVIDFDATSMEIHYSKPANADGKFEKGTVARGKCRLVNKLVRESPHACRCCRCCIQCGRCCNIARN